MHCISPFSNHVLAEPANQRQRHSQFTTTGVCPESWPTAMGRVSTPGAGGPTLADSIIWRP